MARSDAGVADARAPSALDASDDATPPAVDANVDADADADVGAPGCTERPWADEDLTAELGVGLVLLALGEDDRAHALHGRALGAGVSDPHRLVYATRDPSGAWPSEELDEAETIIPHWLHVDGAGVVHVLYARGTWETELVYRRREAGAWSESTPIAEVDSAPISAASAELAPDGTLVVAYTRNHGPSVVGGLDVVALFVAERTSAGVVTREQVELSVRVESEDLPVSISSLELARGPAEGELHIVGAADVWDSLGELRPAHVWRSRAGAAWQLALIEATGRAGVMAHTRDPHGGLHALYRNDADGIRHAHLPRGAGEWSFDDVETAAAYPSLPLEIAAAADGRIYVTYSDGWTSEFNLSWRSAASAWSTEIFSDQTLYNTHSWLGLAVGAELHVLFLADDGAGGAILRYRAGCPAP